MDRLRAEVRAEDRAAGERRGREEAGYSYTRGYGGKFGVMEERQDKSALGWGKEDKKKETETK